MRRVSGLTSEADFASHGRDLYRALQKASPTPLSDFSAILDFGVGSGRLARMFQGFGGHYCGVDVDHELLAWTAGALPWVQPMPTAVRQPLPCGDHCFDCVLSISVFTHMTEADSLFYLRELRRVAQSGAALMLTVHGRRAAERAMREWAIADMLAVPHDEIECAKSAMDAGGFYFARQNGHLTTDEYDYGISFTSEAYIHDAWARFFDVVQIVPGAVHDFQDIVVLGVRTAANVKALCRACKKDFSITSGTLFASHKLPLRGYLAAIAIFCNEVKGKSACALSRDLGLSYKAAFVMLHKLREAMAVELKGRTVGGEGKVAEIDGGYFGGYVKPANMKEHRRDRRFLQNQSGKRKAVVIIRERGGNSVPAVFKNEGQAIRFIQSRVAKGTVINADGAGAWDSLHARYEMKRVDHEEAYSMDGACTNWAEGFFSRMRRMEIGHHHHLAGPYLLRYAQEASWREDNRRSSNGEQVNHLAGLAMKRGKSVDFGGYWQRHITA